MFFARFGLVGISMFVLLAVGVSTAQAQSTNTADLLARMNAIIVQMDALKREITALKATLPNAGTVATTPATGASSGAGAVLGAATTNLQDTVVYGETNETIAKVQRLLAADPSIYPYGVDSGFFGPKTQEAIRAFQAKFGMDPVGVVGPSTSALLLDYFLAYPTGQYPANVFASRPTPKPVVAGAATNNPPVSDTTDDDSGEEDEEKEADAEEAIEDAEEAIEDAEEEIEEAEEEDEETDLAEELLEEAEDKLEEAEEAYDDEKYEEAIELAEEAAELAEEAEDAIGEEERDKDEDEAEEAIEDAEDAIDDAEEAIEAAQDEDEETEVAEELLEEAEEVLEEAEEAFDDGDFDDAFELAKEAEELAEEAEDAIGEEEDDGVAVTEITVNIRNANYSSAVVEFDDGTDDYMMIRLGEEDDIIAYLADELDMDEDDVEDIIDFD